MSALRLVIPDPDLAAVKETVLKRLRGRLAPTRIPLLVTSQNTELEFQEWCETVAVGRDRCLVRMDQALPRGTLLRLDIPNMKMQESPLPGGRRVCQWECTPRSLSARATGSAVIHGQAGYWVVELQLQTGAACELAGAARQALTPAIV